MNAEDVLITPEPRYIQFTGEWLRFDGFKNLPAHILRDFNIPEGSWEVKVSKGAEGTCNLKVDDGVVYGEGDEAVCYATVVQLAMQRSGYMPRVEVREELRFRIRGFHLDIARGGVPTVDTFKRIIRWLFLLKYNYLFIYFEDLFPWRSLPDVGVHRGRLSEDEWRSIVEYGKSYWVTVAPSLELLGHMENILSLPKYAKYRELWWVPRDGTLNASDPEARNLAVAMLKDALSQTEAGLIHIGGDETWSLGRGRSLDKSGFVFKGPELYLSHYGELISIVEAGGKTPVVWGDMLTGIYLPEEERQLWGRVIGDPMWNRVIIANWNYDPRDVEFFKHLIDLVAHYDRQLACPGLANWNRFYPDFDTALTNIKNFLAAARERGLLGFLITAWGDDGEECLFTYLTPLLLASMEYAEGSGNWEAKWLRLSGEGEDVLNARKALGRSRIVNNIKKVIYLDRLWELPPEDRNSLKAELGNVLKALEGVKLPEDLQFIKMLYEVALKVLNNEARPEDYDALIDLYSRLWLSERKPEGLANIIGRFAKSQVMLKYRLTTP